MPSGAERVVPPGSRAPTRTLCNLARDARGSGVFRLKRIYGGGSRNQVA
jgi:hypothetical protein